VQRGDRVLIYMPMTVEGVIAMQACARIGATHSVVFGGFSAKALNERIIDASAQKLGIAPHKIIKTVGDHGNTSAASIPLALAAACADGRIKTGHLVMIEAMGGGFTWGSALIRW
jgi:predicted naringenin-chalcone synthase